MSRTVGCPCPAPFTRLPTPEPDVARPGLYRDVPKLDAFEQLQGTEILRGPGGFMRVVPSAPEPEWLKPTPLSPEGQRLHAEISPLDDAQRERLERLMEMAGRVRETLKQRDLKQQGIALMPWFNIRPDTQQTPYVLCGTCGVHSAFGARSASARTLGDA